ncbi:hypothetical protein [Bacillus cereus]|uniref:hypothetical protein n=1 Tax=Bacillus cereus TaxID=1396 RepID=UPI000BF2EE90|nr:hypothetical protein [Bacillus cereus]PFF63970.1 hypothetical protein CN350_01220 [Bacillus cereus]PFL15313.1 hypothetical protein COJ24_04620 [Bacillus cereus]PFQ03516.1 hypothetical protein COK14_30080 [Bacillus cereus]PGR01010.1 hypothetical protein COA24_11370 [Bacillus cereus]
MNNYHNHSYPNNWDYLNNSNYPQVANITYNQQYERQSNSLYLRSDDVKTEPLGDKFTRYTWENVAQILGGYTDFRIEVPKNQHLISAGYSTNPVGNIYPVQITPHPVYRNVMVLILNNVAGVSTSIDVWVVVKDA